MGWLGVSSLAFFADATNSHGQVNRIAVKADSGRDLKRRQSVAGSKTVSFKHPTPNLSLGEPIGSKSWFDS